MRAPERSRAIDYQGIRAPDGVAVVVTREDGTQANLRRVVLHSPTGFEWGYGGSGPADLALSILADVLGEMPSSRELYHGSHVCDGCNGSGGDESGVCVRCDGAGLLGPVLCLRLHQKFKFEVVAGFDRKSWQIAAADVREWIRRNTRGEAIPA